jgi:hypothetical protein
VKLAFHGEPVGAEVVVVLEMKGLRNWLKHCYGDGVRDCDGYVFVDKPYLLAVVALMSASHNVTDGQIVDPFVVKR